MKTSYVLHFTFTTLLACISTKAFSQDHLSNWQLYNETREASTLLQKYKSTQTAPAEVVSHIEKIVSQQEKNEHVFISPLPELLKEFRQKSNEENRISLLKEVNSLIFYLRLQHLADRARTQDISDKKQKLVTAFQVFLGSKTEQNFSTLGKIFNQYSGGNSFPTNNPYYLSFVHDQVKHAQKDGYDIHQILSLMNIASISFNVINDELQENTRILPLILHIERKVSDLLKASHNLPEGYFQRLGIRKTVHLEAGHNSKLASTSYLPSESGGVVLGTNPVFNTSAISIPKISLPLNPISAYLDLVFKMEHFWVYRITTGIAPDSKNLGLTKMRIEDQIAVTRIGVLSLPQMPDKDQSRTALEDFFEDSSFVRRNLLQAAIETSNKDRSIKLSVGKQDEIIQILLDPIDSDVLNFELEKLISVMPQGKFRHLLPWERRITKAVHESVFTGPFVSKLKILLDPETPFFSEFDEYLFEIELSRMVAERNIQSRSYSLFKMEQFFQKLGKSIRTTRPQ